MHGDGIARMGRHEIHVFFCLRYGDLIVRTYMPQPSRSAPVVGLAECMEGCYVMFRYILFYSSPLALILDIIMFFLFYSILLYHVIYIYIVLHYFISYQNPLRVNCCETCVGPQSFSSIASENSRTELRSSKFCHLNQANPLGAVFSSLLRLDLCSLQLEGLLWLFFFLIVSSCSSCCCCCWWWWWWCSYFYNI